MKQLFYFLTALLVSFSISSCTVVGAGLDYSVNNNYPTHSDKMEIYKSKSQVIAKFGIPTKKDTYQGIEIWHYDLGGYTSTAAAAAPIGSGIYGSSSTSYSNRYVEFQFRGDNVINWRTKGVDFGREKYWLAMWTGFLIDCFAIGAALGSI
jgi:hypothetical protein